MLSSQVGGRLRTLTTDAEIENALLRHGRQLAVFAQMMQHCKETPLAEEDYEVRITRGFTLLKSQPLNIAPGRHALRRLARRHPE
jgi:type III restriction enzyme